MKHLKLLVLSFLVFICTSIAQAQTDKIVDLSKALKIGDTFIAPSNIQQTRGTDKLNWQELENKVIILDFFDTFCGTCIETMPKLQKLQEKLKSKLQIITVSWQDKATLDKFFTTNKLMKENKVNLPVIYSDVYLKERFPHLSVPHIVFLYKGKVQAISGNKVVTEEHILELYDKGQIELPLKDDFGKGNLLGQAKNEMQSKGAIALSGYQNGVPWESLRIKKDSVTSLIKSSFYNVSIYTAVLSTLAKIKKADYIPRPERLILKVNDPDRYVDAAYVGDIWYAKNAISYERLDAIQRTDSAQAEILLQDLHDFLGIRIYKEMQNIECLILKPCPVKPYKGKVPLDGMTLNGSSVLAVMTDMNRIFPPVLDLVKSDTVIKLGEYNNLEELNEQLATYGIVAEIGIGEQEVLVIEEVE